MTREYKYTYKHDTDDTTTLTLITTNPNLGTNGYPPKFEGYSFTGAMDITTVHERAISLIERAAEARNHLDSVCYDIDCQLHGNSLSWNWDVTMDMWIYELPNKAIKPALPKRPAHSLVTTCNDPACNLHKASSVHYWSNDSNQWVVKEYKLSPFRNVPFNSDLVD